MSQKNKIKIIIPKGATTNIKNGLVELTRQIRLKTGERGGFGLGGQDGYGIDYENKVFSMHPFCWCDKDDCRWCNGDAPNFLYKSTKCKIHWYKYIGRSQKQKGKLPKNWLETCIKSLWEKGDCWYEFDMGLRDFSECLTGRQEPSKIYLCFDATNSETIVEAELSPFTENNVDYWGLDAILSDIANAQMEETKEYKKALALDKKYPALREKIRIDAINNCKYQIEWNKHRVKKLEKK